MIHQPRKHEKGLSNNVSTLSHEARPAALECIKSTLISSPCKKPHHWKYKDRIPDLPATATCSKLTFLYSKMQGLTQNQAALVPHPTTAQLQSCRPAPRQQQQQQQQHYSSRSALLRGNTDAGDGTAQGGGCRTFQG